MKYIINITFLSIILLLGANHFFRIVDVKDNNENRKLAEKPTFDVNRLDFYPLNYDEYLKDNFAARIYFVKAYGWLNKTIIHKRSLNGKYLLGDDNHVFEMKKGLPLYTGKRTVTDDQMDRIVTEFNERYAYFNSIGVKMYIQVIPSKYAVYSDKTPLFLRKGKRHMGDRFIKEFNSRTKIPIIDGSKIMLDKAKEHEIYLKYDTHWNKLGAFFVNQALIERMKIDIPSMELMDSSLFDIIPYERDGGNMKFVALDKSDTDFGYKIAPKNNKIKRIKGYKHEMIEGFRYGQDAYCMRYQSANPTLPKVIIIRDSYCGFTYGFLPEMFSETLYIWDDWKYRFNKEIVDIEKPDAVIYSIYEGYIDRLLMEPSFVNADKEDDDIQ